MRLELLPAHAFERLLGRGDETLPGTVRCGCPGTLGRGCIADRREDRHQALINRDLVVGGGRPEAEVMGIHKYDQVSDCPFLAVFKLFQERLHARVPGRQTVQGVSRGSDRVPPGGQTVQGVRPSSKLFRMIPADSIAPQRAAIAHEPSPCLPVAHPGHRVTQPLCRKGSKIVEEQSYAGTPAVSCPAMMAYSAHVSSVVNGVHASALFTSSIDSTATIFPPETATAVASGFAASFVMIS
jgi:hypothetical protein